MLVSRSALERGKPPPRRKSCAACIRAKRRCNLAQPTCSRCSHRMVQCVYPSGQVDRPSHGRLGAELVPFEARSGTVAERTVQTGNCLPNLDIFPRVDYDFDMGALDFLLDTPAIPNQLNRSPLATTTTIDHFPSLPLSPLTPRPLFPAMASKTPGFSGFHISYQRLQYVLEALMNAPKQMAHENALPWCHPQLYRDATPRAMQDAQACSALYAARNRANAAAVRRIVEARVADLIATLSPLPPATDITEPTPPPPPPPPPETATQIPTAAPSPLETLARAHALILYQVMQLFDGDPAARAAAENTMPYLDVMVKALAPIAAEDQPGPFLPEEAQDGGGGGGGGRPQLPLYPLAGTRAFWEEWIVRESARRTVLLMKVLWLLYRLLRTAGPIYCDKNVRGPLRFTASAHLWQATDAVEFALAWGQRKHYVVANGGLVDILAEAEPEDIDQYGRIMLTALLGADEVKGWFISKGGML